MNADNPLRHTKHIFRMAIMLIVVVVALFLGRTLFIPDTWGEAGSFRYANLAEQMAKPVVHGGDESCRGCHKDEFDTHAGQAHAKVRCEVCHAPLATHVKDGTRSAPMATHRDKELCLRCHRKLDARPAAFPQIQPRQHVEDQGGTWAPEVCFDCHQPHAPQP